MQLTDWINGFTIVGGYLVLVATSGIVVRIILSRVGGVPINQKVSKDALLAGAVIGKCENIIILTLMILNAYTALAIVFTAKALVRKEDMVTNSLYFLAGTLVNVTYSIVMGLIVKAILLVF